MKKKAIFTKEWKAYLKSLKPMEQEVIHNETGPWCEREGYLCEHNLLDAPLIRRDVCFNTHCKCTKGSAYSYPDTANKERRSPK